MAQSNEIEKRTNGVISKFLHLVLNEPVFYFSEADLQSILFKFLFEEFNKPIKTNFRRGNESTTMYKTIQVHREYGSNDNSNARMDLCFLKKEDIKEIDDPNLKKGNKYLSPLFGIELGTEKTPDYEKHIKNDIEKLKKLEKGYLIYIFKDTAVSVKESGRGIKTKEKHQKIESFVGDLYKNFIIGTNIHPIFFILHLQKKQKLWGKCNYFDFRNQNWKVLNLQKIESTVKELLN